MPSVLVPRQDTDVSLSPPYLLTRGSAPEDSRAETPSGKSAPRYGKGMQGAVRVTPLRLVSEQMDG